MVKQLTNVFAKMLCVGNMIKKEGFLRMKKKQVFKSFVIILNSLRENKNAYVV